MRPKQDRPYKILIVDDGEDFRRLFGIYLSHFGYQIQKVSNGRKALGLLRKAHDIDLVLLDFHMPGLNGIEVLHKIKKIAPRLNVIILTGYSVQDIAVLIPSGYVQHYIEKATDPDKIRKLIEKVLKKQRAGSDAV
jgi:two-component system, NtrC family, response regulator AtoC